MTKVEIIKEQFNLPYLVANDLVKSITTMIAEELTAHIEFVESDGDLFGIAAGLKRAVQMIKQIEVEGQ